MEAAYMGEGGGNTNMVKFFKKAVKNNRKSEVEGRPIYDELDYISIVSPGDPNNIVERKVRDEDKETYGPIWDKYKKGVEDHCSGTLLEDWPALSAGQREELKAMNFYTVEGLANASQSAIDRFGMGGEELKQKAKAYIEFAKDTAIVGKQAAEIERQSIEIERLKEQIATIAAKQDAGDEAKPRRGRKSKAQKEAEARAA